MEDRKKKTVGRTGLFRRTAAGAAVFLMMLACALLSFASAVQAAAGYKAVTKQMKVVQVGTTREADIIGMNSLNMNNKEFYGSFTLSRDGTVTVTMPRIEGTSTMTVTSGGTSHIYTIHKADGIQIQGNLDKATSFSGFSMGGYTSPDGIRVPADAASTGTYEVWIDNSADYNPGEQKKDDAARIQEESIVDHLNSTPYDRDFVTWYTLTGEGSISMSNTNTQKDGDVFQVTLTLTTSGEESWQYGRQVKKETDGTPGIRIMLSCKGHVDLSGSASGLNTPVIEHVYTPASPDPGEFDGGTPIPAIIVIGATGMLMVAAIKGLEDETGETYEEEKNEIYDGSQYWMRLNKEFGDKLEKGAEPKPVYARIVQVKPSGQEIDRTDMTQQIQISSLENSLNVTDAGMTSNGYRAAMVSVPEDSTASEGAVTFMYSGEGGDFYQHVIFRLQEAQIVFTRDNMGLPANYLKFAHDDAKENGQAGAALKARYGDGEFRLPFLVKDMPEDTRVRAELVKAGVTDFQGKGVKTENHGMPYSLEIRPDEEHKEQGIYEAIFREVLDYELPAGSTEGIVMTVIAESGIPGAKDYKKIEGKFSLYRIHMGLVMTVEASSIPCHVKLKEGREGRKADEIEPDDVEPCFSEGSILLFLCRKSDLEILRIPAVPEKKLKVTAKRLANDRYCHIGDATKDHQNLVDALEICVFPTEKLCKNGARKVRFCSTKGALDAPTRLIAEIEVTVKYQKKEYKLKKDVLLRSQPFRVADTVEESMRQISQDEKITDTLLRIQAKIFDRHFSRLAALYNLIDRMLEGYDSRFGYDPNQVADVQRVWIGFVEGTHMGAKGQAEVVTLADDLAACYAFMQGLRDNTGILGRIAMGVMTAGYSEYVFTTMTLAEEMRNQIFMCRGDKDFGFWDGVIMGVKEFEKQILLEYAMKGVMQGANIYIAKNYNVNLGEKLAKIGAKYRSVMDSADEWMKNNFSLYKAGDNAMKNVKNFFNSSAGTMKNTIQETMDQLDDAGRQADDIIRETRKKMPEAQRRLASQRAEKAMEKGMEKVRKLQKAQQEMEAAASFEERAAAQKKYREIADEVWTDKNALKQLQRNQHPYAQRMRAQFNHYRENLLDNVQRKAMHDIALEKGLPDDSLYCSNASGGTKTDYKLGKKVPADRDITISQKVLSDRSKDFAISQAEGERAVARRLFKEMNGHEASTIEEALEFMKGKDVTYVAPQGNSFEQYIIEPNLEAYTDLGGMIGKTKSGVVDKNLLKNDLKGLALNRQSMAHKGKEWFRSADKSLSDAADLETKALSLNGEAKAASLARAEALRDFAHGETVEGVRQITKQVDNIVIPRSIARNGKNVLPKDAMTLHRIALRVGEDLSPGEFEYILKEQYNLTLDGYAELMSSYLD